MKKVLITGAVGNVGMEVIKSLSKLARGFEIIAAVRNIEKDKIQLAEFRTALKEFDFTDTDTFQPALQDCDVLFLMRPPQISNVGKYFKPLIDAAIREGVSHIVFLSVQGVEKSSVIPHHKIEKLIVESKIPYTFLRPAYFMQNFTTTLRQDLIYKKKIFLPAGKVVFTLIDIRDIGEVAARIIAEPATYLNKCYELTCDDRLTFKEMAIQLSDTIGTTINYQSPSLLSFFRAKRRENIPVAFILVMIMLHYLPRFQKAPALSDWVKKITGRPPVTFKQFIIDHKARLQINDVPDEHIS